MSKLFRKSKHNTRDIPTVSMSEYEPLLRCSICTGEQVLKIKSRTTGEEQELMMIHSPDELEAFCQANGIDVGTIKKVY